MRQATCRNCVNTGFDMFKNRCGCQKGKTMTEPISEQLARQFGDKPVWRMNYFGDVRQAAQLIFDEAMVAASLHDVDVAEEIIRDQRYRALLQATQQKDERIADLEAKLAMQAEALGYAYRDADYFSFRLSQLGVDHVWNKPVESYKQVLNTTTQDVKAWEEKQRAAVIDECLKIIEPIITRRFLRLGVVYFENETCFLVPMLETWQELKSTLQFLQEKAGG